MTTDAPYPEEKLKEVEKIISTSVRKVIKSGLVLGQGDWGVTLTPLNSKSFPPMPTWVAKEKCCMNSAVLVVKQPKPAVTLNTDLNTVALATTCAVLGVSYDFALGLTQGFDAFGNLPEAQKLSAEKASKEKYLQGFRLGLKLGKKFLKKLPEIEQ